MRAGTIPSVSVLAVVEADAVAAAGCSGLSMVAAGAVVVVARAAGHSKKGAQWERERYGDGGDGGGSDGGEGEDRRGRRARNL